MPDDAPQPPPLPPSPFPSDLVARCQAALLAASVRTPRAELEVHRTHLRVVAPVVAEVTEFARRMSVDDLVLGVDDVVALRPVGAMTVIVELRRDAAIALAGPSVRSTLDLWSAEVPRDARRLRPFFVNFWLIHNRTGRVQDSRPMS